MNQFNEKDLQTHVKILGWIHLLGNAFFLVMGLFMFVLLGGIGLVSGELEAFTILGIVATFVGGMFVVLAVPGMVAGYGLLKQKSWARILAIIVGALGIMNFPLGTAVGLYTFFVLFQDSAADYFTTPKMA